MRPKGRTGQNQDVAWYAAFTLGIAFSQDDDRAALRELHAAFADRPAALSPTMRYLSGLPGVDDVTRARALALVSEVAADIKYPCAGIGLPA